MNNTAPRALALLALTLTAVVLAACSDNNPVTGPFEIADMNWILVDRCDDGLGLQARFFDVDRDLVWPGRGSVFATGPGGIIDALITCEVGDLICHGTETDPADGLFWGLALDGRAGCENCCEVCRNLVVEFELFCAEGIAKASRTR